MKSKHIVAYMKTAYNFAECSQSTRLKVGAVLVRDNNILSCGYNALPEHMTGPLEDDQGRTRPEVRHAEINALYRLVTRNESSAGSTLFITHSPCKMCAIDIVDAKVETVYYYEEYRSSEGLTYLSENGINVIQLNKQELFSK